MNPYIYRTHDGGRTWTNIVSGIPDGAFVNSVKEDPKAKGLLYAATELRVYVSLDDGSSWHPLQNNMPVTSVRDIIVHGDDLAIATHGRGFWVLDQMTPLREIASTPAPQGNAHLFAPGETYAIRTGGQNGTPLPHEEPQEQNPPQGVVTYYWLKTAPAGPIKLELVDASGRVRVCAASDTPVKPVDTEAINVQAYWQVPAPPPSAQAGMHRFALNVPAQRFGGGGPREAAPEPPHDACYMPPAPESAQPRPSGNRGGQPGAAAGAQPGAQAGGRRQPPGLEPGAYTVRLTVDGQTYTQSVTLKPDPRGPGADRASEGEDEDDRS
jgi:hypothetical protein